MNNSYQMCPILLKDWKYAKKINENQKHWGYIYI